jgi:hypothetical protein
MGGGVGALIFSIAILTGFVARVSGSNKVPSIPIVTIIAPPTITIPVHTQPATNPTFEPTILPTLPPSAVDAFLEGQLVAVSGTGGDGLRIRNQPGLEMMISFVALENEVFEVTGGPVEVDGYTWWFLVNPYDVTKSGWAASNFLRPMESQ